MKTNNQHLNEYTRVMSNMCIEDEAKQRIIRNCARYSTLKKIKSGKFRLIAVIKETTVEKI